MMTRGGADMQMLFKDQNASVNNTDPLIVLGKEPSVTITIGGKSIPMLLDSGSELSILRLDVLPSTFEIDKANSKDIALLGAFGPEVGAKLVKVEAALADEFESDYSRATLNIAVCDKLNGNVGLLSSHDYLTLLNINNVVCTDIKMINNSGKFVLNCMNNNVADIHDNKVVNDNDDVQLSQGLRFDNHSLFDLDLSKESYAQFKIDQANDATLAMWWVQAGNGSKEYIIDSNNSLLYRKHITGGIDIFQLVLPENKRQSVMSAYHNTQQTLHLGPAKTMKSLKAYFIWPGITQHVRAFVASCPSCQNRSRIIKIDRVIIPIVPMSPRSEER